jgi:hypothetical protein
MANSGGVSKAALRHKPCPVDEELTPLAPRSTAGSFDVEFVRLIQPTLKRQVVPGGYALVSTTR